MNAFYMHQQLTMEVMMKVMMAVGRRSGCSGRPVGWSGCPAQAAVDPVLRPPDLTRGAAAEPSRLVFRLAGDPDSGWPAATSSAPRLQGVVAFGSLLLAAHVGGCSCSGEQRVSRDPTVRQIGPGNGLCV